MPFDFTQAEQMLNGSYQQRFSLKVRLKTWRLCLQVENGSMSPMGPCAKNILMEIGCHT